MSDHKDDEKAPAKIIPLNEGRKARDQSGKILIVTEVEGEVAHHDNDSTLKKIGNFLFKTQAGRIIVYAVLILIFLEPEFVQNAGYAIGSQLLGFVIWAAFILGIFWLIGQLAESTKKKWKGVAGGGDHGKKGGHH